VKTTFAFSVLLWFLLGFNPKGQTGASSKPPQFQEQTGFTGPDEHSRAEKVDFS
jgi:hypothetical protein